MDSGPHRLIEGQRSLFEAELGEPPVKYSRVCRLRLKTEKSINRGVGPVCARRQRQKETSHAD
jgi:hypothetical protein